MRNGPARAFKLRDEMRSLFSRVPKTMNLTCMFGAFVFLQFTVLGLANHAGEGYLSIEHRELVYYALQVFVISGYLLYSLFFRFCTGKRVRSIISFSAFGIFFICMFMMLTTGHDSLKYVIISMTAALCLGGIGGAAHLRMSMETFMGSKTVRCMGLGSAAAVVLQYLLQIRRAETPLLFLFMPAAFLLFTFLLLFQNPETVIEDGKKAEKTPPLRIVLSVLITVIFLLFACFYNEYIHHLQISSDYGAYNAYSWPRLMLVPGYLLFAAIGDRKNGKYVPIASLCIMLVSLLTVVLIEIPEANWLNMCLFYFVVSAFTSYYLLTFWRLAPGTGNPALWAPFGRIMLRGFTARPVFRPARGLRTFIMKPGPESDKSGDCPHSHALHNYGDSPIKGQSPMAN